MKIALKHAFSAVIVTVTFLAMGVTVNASEHKYPIFERETYRDVLGSKCQGDKELVWTQGEKGAWAPRLCRQKCPADWITTKKFCIKDKSVSFPRRTRKFIGKNDPCDKGEIESTGNVFKSCSETCPEGMKLSADVSWCEASHDTMPSALKFSSPFDELNQCPPGMERVNFGDYLFCAKPMPDK